jgi:hypothetical protein
LNLILLPPHLHPNRPFMSTESLLFQKSETKKNVF